MDVTIETVGDLKVIQIDSERIDAASAIRFKDTMREATSGWMGRVVLDMHKVDFIDSSGLGAIVSCMKSLESKKRLELASLSPKVVKVFRLTRMDTVFTVHASLEDAKSLGSTAA
ncbi:MAG: STAS domain-containing protein [Pseudomonadota bacterium]